MVRNRIYNVVFTLLLIASAIMYGLLMFNNNVWYDEAYSLAMIEHGFGEIARITAADVHPPLYYYGLKLFSMAFGYNLISAKIFSIIPILLTMLLGYYNLGQVFGKKTGLAFAIALALMPLYQSYAVEIRMYTWASFTVFGCGVFAFRAISENKRRYWILYAVFGVLSAYLHYFAFLSVVLIYFLSLLGAVYKSRVPAWFINAVFSLLAYMPWMSSFLMQLGEKINNEYWIGPITEETVREYFRVWLQCGEYTDLYIWVFAAVCLASLAIIIAKKQTKMLWAVFGSIFVFVMTCALGIGVSIVVRPVFLERYAVPAIPLVLVLIAFGVGAVKSKVFTSLIAAVGIGAYAASYPYIYNNEYNSTEMYIAELLEETEYDALICCVDSHLYGVLAYYSPEKPVYRPRTSTGSPFDNILPLNSRNIDEEKTTLLFLPQGEAIPSWACMGYDVEYKCDVATYGMTSNVYTCTKIIE